MSISVDPELERRLRDADLNGLPETGSTPANRSKSAQATGKKSTGVWTNA